MELRKVEKIFKALADQSRLLIIRSLLEKPQYLEELAERLNLAVSTVSFHVKKLEAAGLIYKQKQQYYTIFFIKRELLTKNLEELMNFDYDERSQQEDRIKRYKKKVIDTFMKDGHIMQIPAQKQKRWIVFEQILDEFEFGKEYTELEVNRIINKFHEDHCTIRRTFVQEKVMNRVDGIYSLSQNYENFRKGKRTETTSHGLIEGFEQSIRDKFGVS